MNTDKRDRKVFSFLSLLWIGLLCVPGFAKQDGLFQTAMTKNLDQSYIWHSLLHLDATLQPQIKNSDFLLSYHNFSPKNELNATLEAFKHDQTMICRFPARYLWLKQYVNITEVNISKKCPDFGQYLQQTRPTDLQLVFASEDVKNPSSMMGHVFFKLIGNHTEWLRKRENAVSFFALIDTANIPRLLIESTMTGMKGYFLLTPYSEQINRYLYDENRNVWEYDLTLTDEQKKLIYYHFWELKDVPIKYYFIGFNCATIVDDMLSMASKTYQDSPRGLWITPRDVIKRANENRLIASMTLRPSLSWKLNMLQDHLDERFSKKIADIFERKRFEELNELPIARSLVTGTLEKELIATYTTYYQRYQAPLDTHDLGFIQRALDHRTSDMVTDLSRYKNPINTANDSQLSIGVHQHDKKNYLRFEFLPASNTLDDDNRQYFNETSLRIGNFTLLADSRGAMKVEMLNLYTMKSLIPVTPLTSNPSIEFQINYEPQYGRRTGMYGAYNMSGAVGLTKRLTDDLYVYAMGGGGVAYGADTVYPYGYTELGVLLYEILKMKSVFEYKYIYNQEASCKGYHDLRLHQSLFFTKDIRFGLNLHMIDDEGYHRGTADISANFYF